MSSYIATIQFRCSGCGSDNSLRTAVPEPNWLGDNADERFTSEIEVLECKHCQMLFDVEIKNQDGAVTVDPIDCQGVDFTSSEGMVVDDDDMDSEWRYEIPSNPADSIWQTLSEVSELLKQLGNEYDSSVLNRMAFAQQVAALEAYLGDKLLREISDNPSSLRRLAVGDSDLRAMKIGLVSALDEDDPIKAAVIDHLQKQSFHNLAKVQVLYKIAFALDITPDKEQRERLQRAINTRHDCVHRNGFNKAGERISFITASYVRQMDNDIRSLVMRIEDWLTGTF